jgi:hypothetical protein
MFDKVMATAMLVPLGLLLWIMYKEIAPSITDLLPLSAKRRSQLRDRYQTIVSMVQDNFLFRERLAVCDAALDLSIAWRTRGDARKCIDGLVKSLDDRYTRLLTGDQLHSEKRAHAKRGVASSKMLPGDIGYVQISTFHSVNCAEETRRAFENVAHASGFILDLRGNLGGFLDQSFQVFSLLFDAGLYSEARGWRDNGAYTTRYELTAEACEIIADKPETRKRFRNVVGGKPLVVLVNERSASASEMLSGALKGRPNVTVVGGRTFGKGVGQITPDKHGKDWLLKVTSFYFYLPGGECIHGKGVEPDVLVPYCSCCDQRLAAAKKVLSAKLRAEEPVAAPPMPMREAASA